jgi:hypothetical protein
MLASLFPSTWGVGMSTFNPRTFLNPDRICTIAPDLLFQFLGNWQGFFDSKSFDLTPLTSAKPHYAEVAKVLLASDGSMPPEMVDALHYIDEMARDDAIDALLERAEDDGHTITVTEDSSSADAAIQVWQANPELLIEVHAETLALKQQSFMYYAGKKTNRRDLMKHTAQEDAAIQSKVDDWFAQKRRGRGSRVFFFKNDKKVWIVIRHGKPMQREGSHNEDGTTGIAFYRPQEHDVLVYDRKHDEMGVNCSSRPLREHYLEVMGDALFGDKYYFNTATKYTLAPLATLGANALTCHDVDGIDMVRLGEVQIPHGGGLLIFKHNDVFAADSAFIKMVLLGSISRASFKVKFTNSKNPRTVNILPSSVARYTQKGDSTAVEEWLKKRGFDISEAVGEDDDDDENLGRD